MSAYDTEQLDRLDPAYLANYGLNKAPFSNQHDDRFLYLDAERAQRLNLLQHMTQYSNLLLIVLGEEGVGKTSLLTRFITTKAENWHICQVTANTFMDAGQLMFQVAQGFGVHRVPSDAGQLQEMLYSQVATYHHNDQIPILLIDDAHELPKDALMGIFHLADAQVDDANLLRIILFAEPQIEKILNSREVRPLRERITHTMSIPLLDEDTTAEYLKHRMAVAGFNGGSPFTPKMVKRIFRASGGNPARINQLAHETLDKGDFEREPEEVESIVKPAKPRRLNTTRLAVIAVAILAIVILVFQNRINRLFDGKSGKTTTLPLTLTKQEGKPSTDKKQPETPTPPVAGQVQGADQKPVVVAGPTVSSSGQATTGTASSSSEQGKLQEKIIPLNPSSGAKSSATPAPSLTPSQSAPKVPAATHEPAIAEANPAQTSAAAQAPAPGNEVPKPKLIRVDPDPVPASDKPQTILVNGQGFTGKTRVYVRWTNTDHEIPPARVKLVSDKQLQVRLTVGRDHDKWQMHVVNPEDKDSNVLDFRVATPGFNQDQRRGWIASQPPDHYTLQLFGSHEQKNAIAFIQQHKLGEQAKYFASRHKGRTWYSVIYGSYPDKPAAQAASKSLPASLHGIKPWIRRFADVQASEVKPGPAEANKNTARPVIPAPDSKVFTTRLPRHGDVEQNESWIWSQDPSYFTLQLTGGHELAGIKHLLKRYPGLSSHAVYFRSQRNGQTWYAIIYGVYPNRQKAQAAVKSLPASLQKSKPWIRSFASIHAELSRSH